MFSILETETEDIKTQGNQQRPPTAVIRKEYEKLKRELEKRERERESHQKIKRESQKDKRGTQSTENRQ